ncbi:unnamed protein product [Triticum turgidum subsp. durum]|uniref:Bacterial surface antigen (D15) domain-containing protein n=1 Tax=Triticum turgidum subsp. durum TaxID=4567 RepID=A0A9R0R330_TRITD|nr:unnamed protein product [Triticum turgidum subsp. durum]
MRHRIHSGRISLKHPSLFGRSEKLDVILDKGVNDSNVVVAFRRPRPEWLSQQSFVIQHSMTPEIAVHGFPADNFTRSGSRGVNLSRLSLGVEINEPTTSKWTSGTSVKFEHIRPVNNDGRSIARDHEGFPLTCSGNLHDNMIILKQESGYADVKDNSFLRAKNLEGSLFMDCGSDLGSARHVPGNPALRQGKPGFGVGFGYGVHFNTDIGQIRVDYAMNAFSRKTFYFSINTGGAGS